MTDTIPIYRPSAAPTVSFLGCVPGAERERLVESWLGDARDAGAVSWRLQCGQDEGGLWAGLAQLVDALIPQLRTAAPDLLRAHAYEISLVLPRFEAELEARRPLTETAPGDEQTRNYSADRAYRSLHGLIDLIGAWHERFAAAHLAIACDDYDRTNGLVRRFFRELARRRGEQLGLQLLLVGQPDAGGAATSGFHGPVETFHVNDAVEERGVADPAELTAAAEALESELEAQIAWRWDELPRLVHLWRGSTRPDRALRCELAAMSAFNHYGLYEASMQYADAVERALPQLRNDPAQYFAALSRLYYCFVTQNLAERALRITEPALELLEGPDLPELHYMVGMLHARFLKPADLDRSELLVERAIELVTQVELEPERREFLTVFLMNGLAFVRVRQQRTEEALQLCTSGLERLRRHLVPTRHQLHRSVLYYNIAQVYAQTGRNEEALEGFAATMELDPNYSEYYNERGAIYLRMQRLGDARADLLTAIELSPPYAEVLVNLGQCLRAEGRMSEAVDAYSRALDLDPSVTLAWAGRGDARADLGLSARAAEDFGAALELDPTQPAVWAGRAVARYELGDVEAALRDLDRAVELAPDIAELRQNRAVARRDLGLLAGAAADLVAYLDLSPEAEDRDDVEAELSTLLSMAGQPAT